MNLKIAFTFLLSWSCFFSHAQLLSEAANDSLVKIPEYFASQQLKENIYIHTDKDIYEPGENLWFKAYLLNGNTLKLSTETQLIFVELIHLTEDGSNIVTTEKYEAINGFANGHLFLERGFETGAYQIRIHTKKTMESTSEKLLAVKEFKVVESVIPTILMDVDFSKKNYNRNEAISAEITVFSRSRVPYKNTVVIAYAFAGSKRIYRNRLRTNDEGVVIVNLPAEKSKKATTIKLLVKDKRKDIINTFEIPFTSMSELQFGLYPEGGSLVENLPNTVAFKALDPSGRPVAVKGILYENGKKIQPFTATHNGMGKFAFVPKNNQNYTVKITQPTLDSIFELPKILPEGIKLQVDRHTKKYVHFSITRTKNILDQQLYIRAQHRGLVYWMATTSLSKERVRFKLPLEKFPQGIVEVTLFNEQFQPVAERLVYANLDQKLHVTLKEISKSFYQQKDKVTMKFEVKDQNKNPAIANFSLSVHDHLYADKNNDYAMLPHYYLFSELKGHVYDAGYYFNPKNNNREEHLDVLLLTQGWRNYVWNSKQLNYVENSLDFTTNIKGKIYKKLKNGALQNIPLATVNVSYPSYTENVTTNMQAEFSLPISSYKNAQGSNLVFIPFEDKNAVIRFTDPFENIEEITGNYECAFPKYDLALQTKKQSSYNPEFSFTETNFLEEVNLGSFRDRNKDEGNVVMYNDIIPDYVCRFNILNCTNHPNGTPPVDGKTYRYNDGTIVTYVGKKEEPKDEKDKLFVKIKGFYPEKEFYSPQYDKNPDEALFPDNRKTLFWAPNLISDENGIITVSFFTSDMQTTFLGTIEGTNGNGLLGGTSFQFDVN
ncbi:MG2 domain protein [Kordia sp. SMS9]|uniref:MG2 domain-containing protein n=1 Tax=Kordia sp. SMS9 TaxID=2282170 RepID=UPI000E0E016B|nr:MG2 domain-containing protein [Kordia sp. SMS9]AXG71878.1 MG2 domain protein [Kordia sp. SMS9]